MDLDIFRPREANRTLSIPTDTFTLLLACRLDPAGLRASLDALESGTLDYYDVCHPLMEQHEIGSSIPNLPFLPSQELFQIIEQDGSAYLNSPFNFLDVVNHLTLPDPINFSGEKTWNLINIIGKNNAAIAREIIIEAFSVGYRGLEQIADFKYNIENAQRFLAACVHMTHGLNTPIVQQMNFKNALTYIQASFNYAQNVLYEEMSEVHMDIWQIENAPPYQQDVQYQLNRKVLQGRIIIPEARIEAANEYLLPKLALVSINKKFYRYMQEKPPLIPFVNKKSRFRRA